MDVAAEIFFVALAGLGHGGINTSREYAPEEE